MMNRIQKKYLKAKSELDALLFQSQKIESDYIKENNIVNKDGSVPECVYMIDDDEAFEKANTETEGAIEGLGIHTARENLWKAENNLITFALSLVPEKVSKPLLERCFGLNQKTILYKVREQVIDLAFQLDTRTIPKMMVI